MQTSALDAIAQCSDNASKAVASGQHRIALSMLARRRGTHGWSLLGQDRCLELAPQSKALQLKKAEVYLALKDYPQASSLAVCVPCAAVMH